jgi:hypothetical protein
MILDVKVGLPIGVDNGKITRAENYIVLISSGTEESDRIRLTSVLDLNAEEHHMPKLNRMNRHDATHPQVTSPILIGIPVINLVFYIVGQEILKLDGCTQFELDSGKLAKGKGQKDH